MFCPDLVATPGAATDPHPVLGHSGSGQRRKVGNVGEIHPLFLQLSTAAGAGLQGHPHIHWRFGDFLGTWCLAKGEGAFTRLAAGAPGLPSTVSLEKGVA